MTPPVETPWTPEMPLRADATDAQMLHRWEWLCGYKAQTEHLTQILREYAAACVAASKVCDCGLPLSTGLCRVCDNDE
jgi:hypothetical protein